MQRALAPGHDGAAKPVRREFDAAEQTRKATAGNQGIKFHPATPSPDHKAPGRPSG